jgi:hypothetical protein
MKTRHYASEGRFKPGDKKTAADGPPETRLTGSHPPFPTLPAHGPSGRAASDGFGKAAMSANDVAACFIGTFLGLVAAALLIAVLG